jgi:hypothetical protein
MRRAAPIQRDASSIELETSAATSSHEIGTPPHISLSGGLDVIRRLPSPEGECNVTSRGLVSTVIAIAGLLATSSGPALADELPTPFDFVSNLDLECYKATPEPPPAPQVELHHLNPAMKGMTQMAALGELERVCLPVAKNGAEPPDETLAFIQWVDLACYQADAEPVGVPLKVRHLNPELAHLPDETVRITELDQVCVPVRKRQGEIQIPIPEHVRRLVQFIDIACYRLEEETLDAMEPLTLSHLNPIVKLLHLEDRETTLRRARQLCLPVSKNNEQVPHDVLHVVSWVDFLRYTLDPIPPVSFQLDLRHLNPLYANRPWFGVNLFSPPPVQLMVPIAKSISTGGGGIPPDSPPAFSAKTPRPKN